MPLSLFFSHNYVSEGLLQIYILLRSVIYLEPASKAPAVKGAFMCVFVLLGVTGHGARTQLPLLAGAALGAAAPSPPGLCKRLHATGHEGLQCTEVFFFHTWPPEHPTFF